MTPEAASKAHSVLLSGYIGEGKVVKKFEHDLIKYFNKTIYNNDIITCNSATSAEHMLYYMLKKPRILNSYLDNAMLSTKWSGQKWDSEVISTPLTCTATNWPILHNHWNLVWADIDPTTMNISLDSIRMKINQNTRIIQVVHWGGYPVDMDKLNQIVNEAQQEYNTSILIVEDCAHAFGSLYKGYNVGFTGNFSTFSTQAIKHLTTVDGGFLSSPFKEFSEVSRLIRWYGIDRNSPREDFRCENDIPEIGFKFHMNDVNAAIGIENLSKIDAVISRHKSNGQYYNKHLQNIPGITLLENDPFKQSSYWLYTFNVENRDGFMKKMAEKNIMVSRVHERNDKHSALDQFKTYLPNLDQVSKTMICIPVGWWVTNEDLEYIVNSIKEGW